MTISNSRIWVSIFLSLTRKLTHLSFYLSLYLSLSRQLTDLSFYLFKNKNFKNELQLTKKKQYRKQKQNKNKLKTKINLLSRKLNLFCQRSSALPVPWSPGVPVPPVPVILSYHSFRYLFYPFSFLTFSLPSFCVWTGFQAS